MIRHIADLFLMSILLIAFAVPALAESAAASDESVKPKTPKIPAAQEKNKEDAKPAEAQKPAEAKPTEASNNEKGKPASSSPETAPSKPATTQPAGKPLPPTGAPPSTYIVKKGPFKISIDLEGLFESRTTREIIVKPEEWLSLKVVEAASHGQSVKEGDVLLKFDTDKLDQAISDLQTDQQLGDLTIRQMADQLAAADKLVPIDLDFSQRRAQMAEEDQKNYFDIDRAFYLKMADFSLHESNNKLEYDEEELRQLEKMYKADDITEETEKIVLKRAQDTVNRSKFMVEYNQLFRDQTVKFGIPRMDNQIKDLTQRALIDWDRNKITLPLAIQKQHLELEKMKIQYNRTAERLKKLEADRQLMIVRSPIDGIVYYGKAMRGRFGDSTAIGETLRPNCSVQPNQVIMTVVQPDDLFIHTAVSEDQMRYIHRGQKGQAIPSAYPDDRLAVRVDRLSQVPISPGSFDLRLSLKGEEPEVALEPGMACKIKLVGYLKKAAITVPPKVLIPDELDDQKFFVYLLKKDGKTQKASVTVGKKTDKKVEILGGLKEGDQVLLEPPRN